MGRFWKNITVFFSKHNTGKYLIKLSDLFSIIYMYGKGYELLVAYPQSIFVGRLERYRSLAQEQATRDYYVKKCYSNFCKEWRVCSCSHFASSSVPCPRCFWLSPSSCGSLADAKTRRGPGGELGIKHKLCQWNM